MMNNNRGFTLVETMIAVGLLAIVTGATAMIISESSKSLRSLEKDISDATESEIAERILMRDLKLAEPSFNNIIMLDDKKNDFFDFVSDAVDKMAVENSARTYTMDIKSKTTFTILTIDEAPGGAIFYDPVMAYAVGPEPVEWDQAATLTFISLNKDGYLQTQNPAYWYPGRILLLDTPIAIRELGPKGPDYKVSPRSPSFVGVVPPGIGSLTPLAVPKMPGLFNTSHPLFPTKVISSEDIFLRSLPPVGGGAALVRMRTVRLIQYELVSTKTAGVNNLVRKMWDGAKNTWGNSQIIGTNVTTAVFSRKATNDPIVYFLINRPAK